MLLFDGLIDRGGLSGTFIACWAKSSGAFVLAGVLRVLGLGGGVGSGITSSSVSSSSEAVLSSGGVGVASLMLWSDRFTPSCSLRFSST